MVVDSIINNISLHADAIFITGDISEDRTRESYAHALKQVERLNLPIDFLAGNHDDSGCLQSVFRRSSFVVDTEEIIFGDWMLINVDTVQQGQDSGLFSCDEKKARGDKIAEFNGKKVALFMHHHPLLQAYPSWMLAC